MQLLFARRKSAAAQCRDVTSSPWKSEEKPCLAAVPRAASTPTSQQVSSDQLSMSGETELETGLCNEQLKEKVYKNAVLKGWEHGQLTLKLCNSCSAQG